MPSFTLEKVADEGTGTMVDTVIKKHDDGTREEWCSVLDLDRLFDTCVSRWGKNWNLEKVLIAIRESEID